MASFATRGKTLLTKFPPKLPEKLKGGFMGRIGDFFQNIARDYKAAVRDMLQDMKDAPGKSAFYISLLTAGAVLAKSNPSQDSFLVALHEAHHELLLLGDPIRNHLSDSHVKFLQDRYREGTLRYANCGLFSVMWLGGDDPEVKLFRAQCSLVKPRWCHVYKEVVDVGLLGRWHVVHRLMADFDINPLEWDAQGNKAAQHDQSVQLASKT